MSFIAFSEHKDKVRYTIILIFQNSMWFRLLPIVILICTNSKHVVAEQFWVVLSGKLDDVAQEKPIIRIWVSSSYYWFDDHLGPICLNVFLQAPNYSHIYLGA